MIVETFHYHLENEIESGSENIINHFTWLSCSMTFLDTHYVVLNNFDTTIRPLVRHWKVLAGENHLKSHLPPYHTHTHTPSKHRLRLHFTPSFLHLWSGWTLLFSLYLFPAFILLSTTSVWIQNYRGITNAVVYNVGYEILDVFTWEHIWLQK